MEMWTADKIRVLRMRMGWSQSDLARRLCCDSAIVQQWETSQLTLDEESIQSLEILLKQAELASDELNQAPQAEVTLAAKELDFIDSEELNS